MEKIWFSTVAESVPRERPAFVAGRFKPWEARGWGVPEPPGAAPAGWAVAAPPQGLTQPLLPISPGEGHLFPSQFYLHCHREVS